MPAVVKFPALQTLVHKELDQNSSPRKTFSFSNYSWSEPGLCVILEGAISRPKVPQLTCTREIFKKKYLGKLACTTAQNAVPSFYFAQVYRYGSTSELDFVAKTKGINPLVNLLPKNSCCPRKSKFSSFSTSQPCANMLFSREHFTSCISNEILKGDPKFQKTMARAGKVERTSRGTFLLQSSETKSNLFHPSLLKGHRIRGTEIKTNSPHPNHATCKQHPANHPTTKKNQLTYHTDHLAVPGQAQKMFFTSRVSHGDNNPSPKEGTAFVNSPKIAILLCGNERGAT